MADRYVEWHHARATTAIAPTGAKKKRRVTDKQRIRSKLYNVSLDIRALRQQIYDLQVHRNLLYTRQLYRRTDGDGSIVRTAGQFFTLTSRECTEREMQDAFMAIMSEDIAFGPFCGRDLFAMYHHLHSPWTKSVVFHLKSIRIVSRDDDTGSFSIVVSGVNRSPMTLSILRFIYPAGLKYPELVDKLAGQPWSFHGSIIAEFDARSQIVRYDPDLDFLGGLSQLMGDSLRAAELMKEAVKDQCGIIYWYDRLQAEASIRAPRIEEVFQLEAQPPSSKERQSVQILLS